MPQTRRFFTQNTSVNGHGVSYSRLDAWGTYVELGYRPPVLSKKIEADVRYSYYNPDRTEQLSNSVSQSAWTLGAQYYFFSKEKLTVDYELRRNDLIPDIGNRLMVELTINF